MGYILNGVSWGGIPLELILALKEGFDCPYFVETGTARGESVVLASKHFEICHTIEIVPDTVPKDITIFNEEKGEPELLDVKYPENINFHIGSSVELLPEIIKCFDKDKYAFLWLDAHYSDPVEPDSELDECPILKEITLCSEHQKSVILIDDARLFYGHPPKPHNAEKWVDFDSLIKTLESRFPDNSVTIVDDYIVSMPKEMMLNFNKYWSNTYFNRYP
jgi:hypothetical protein